MRRELMNILVCPVCRSALSLTVEEEQSLRPGSSETEIVAGSLRCTGCGNVYPIKDTIPNLLPPGSPAA